MLRHRLVSPPKLSAHGQSRDTFMANDDFIRCNVLQTLATLPFMVFLAQGERSARASWRTTSEGR